MRSLEKALGPQDGGGGWQVPPALLWAGGRWAPLGCPRQALGPTTAVFLRAEASDVEERRARVVWCAVGQDELNKCEQWKRASGGSVSCTSARSGEDCIALVVVGTRAPPGVVGGPWMLHAPFRTTSGGLSNPLLQRTTRDHCRGPGQIRQVACLTQLAEIHRGSGVDRSLPLDFSVRVCTCLQPPWIAPVSSIGFESLSLDRTPWPFSHVNIYSLKTLKNDLSCGCGSV